MTRATKWRLLGCGRSGQVQVDLDQSLSAENLLALEFTTAGWSLRFGISGLNIVRELAAFLSSSGEESMVAGTFEGSSVEFRRDCEYPDRFFIVAGHGLARAEFTIVGQQQVSELSKALSEAARDLE